VSSVTRWRLGSLLGVGASLAGPRGCFVLFRIIDPRPRIGNARAGWPTRRTCRFSLRPSGPAVGSSSPITSGTSGRVRVSASCDLAHRGGARVDGGWPV